MPRIRYIYSRSRGKQGWGDLLHSVGTGENAFQHVNGPDPWTFRARHPERSAVFERAMADLSRQVIGSVLAAYDVGRFATIVDVGGGNGAFLAAILAAYPLAHGVAFDRPHVVEGAPSVLAAAGMVDRVEIAGGSFFEDIPTGGGAHILKAILHDWEDDRCVDILRSYLRAMPGGAALLVVERDLGPVNAVPGAKLSDLNMLVAPGGRERTGEEYAALFGASGFRLGGATPATVGVSVFEGAAA